MRLFVGIRLSVCAVQGALACTCGGIKTTVIEIAPSELEFAPGRWHVRVMAEDADGDGIVRQPSSQGQASA
jgi:hypothetical protein